MVLRTEQQRRQLGGFRSPRPPNPFRSRCRRSFPGLLAKRPSIGPARAALAIDGGGVRGLIPARLLCEIERRTGKPIADLFDQISGSSIGGILALTLVKPGVDGTPAYSAEHAASLLSEALRSVFTPRWWHTVPIIGFVSAMARPKYSRCGADALLRDHFGDARMGDALAPVAIGAYDIGAGEPRLFRSEARDECSLMRYVAVATSAAPGFLPPAPVDGGDESATYIDDGLFSNNAGMVAYSEMVRRGVPNEEMLIVSLGAGRSRCRLDPDRAARWGFFN